MNAILLASLNAALVLLGYFLLSKALVGFGHVRLALPVFLVLAIGQLWLVPYLIADRWLPSPGTVDSIRWTNWFVSAFAVVLLPKIARSVPQNVIEASRLDGHGFLTETVHVVLPFVRPALFILVVLTILGTWSEFLRPVAALFRQPLQPLLPALDGFRVRSGLPAGVGMMMAISGVMSVPAVALLIFQRPPESNLRRSGGSRRADGFQERAAG